MTPEILEKMLNYIYEAHTDWDGGTRHRLEDDLRELVQAEDERRREIYQKALNAIPYHEE